MESPLCAEPTCEPWAAENEDTLKTFLDRLKKEPGRFDLWNDLGNLYKEQGDFRSAQESYSQGLVLAPGQPTLLFNKAVLDCLAAPLKDWDQIAAPILASGATDIVLLYEMVVRAALSLWAKNDRAALDVWLTTCAAFSDMLAGPESHNTRNMRTYQRFVTALARAPIQSFEPQAGVALIGDSHGLSYARALCCVPELIMGTKAWHLARRAPNAYKTSFEMAVARLGAGAQCYLSFGEIDCRITEGFIHHIEKAGGDISALIAETVSSYVAYAAQAVREKDCSPIFIGVPAPNIEALQARGLNLGNEKALLLAQTIRQFNQSLEASTLAARAGFVDVFKLTAGENGFSSGVYHIDQFHLKTEALGLAPRKDP